MSIGKKYLKIMVGMALISLVGACSTFSAMTGPEKVALACEASSQVIESINNVIEADIIKVNNDEDPVLSLKALDRFELSKNIIVSYCTTPELSVTEGLTAIMAQYSNLKTIEMETR